MLPKVCGESGRSPRPQAGVRDSTNHFVCGELSGSQIPERLLDQRRTYRIVYEAAFSTASAR